MASGFKEYDLQSIRYKVFILFTTVPTIKGAGSASGMSRYEWEKEISVEDARELFLLCRDGIIDKTRHMVPYEGKIFEVDEFHGENSGLVVAEIELGSEDEAFSRPPWLGKEVTGDRRYHEFHDIKNTR